MEPRQYVAILVRRWPILAAAVFAGIAGSGVVTLLTPATYTSSTSVLFTAEQGTRAAEARQGEQYAEASITSFVDLARTPAVLGPVIEQQALRMSPDELADALDIRVTTGTTLIEITANMGSAEEAVAVADAVSQQLRAVLVDLAPGAGASGLTVTEVSPAQRPEFQSSPSGRRNGAIGGAVGLLVGVGIACGLETRRPRLAGRRDAESLTGLPVWEVARGSSATSATRDGRAGMDRVSLAISSDIDLSDVRSISVQTASSRCPARKLATRLGPTLGDDVEVRDEPQNPEARSDPGLIHLHRSDRSDRSTSTEPAARTLIVVQPGRTSRRAVLEHVSQPASTEDNIGLLLATRRPESTLLRRLRSRLADPESGPPPERSGLALGPGGAPVLTSTALTALAALGLAGMSYPLPFGTNSAFLAALALAPLWLSVMPRFRWATTLFVLLLVSLAAGFLLSDWSSVDHAIDGRIAAETSFRFLGAFGTMGLILWARRFLAMVWIGLPYGVGALLTGLTQLPGSPNPWKFQLAFGVTVVVLAIVSNRNRSIVSIGALIALGLVSVVLDFRSWFAFCAVGAALLIWQARPRVIGSRPAPRIVSILLLAGVALASYAAATFAIVEGYLGDELQQRSVAQIQASGSLIAGGRPEWTVTWVLMQDRPLGYGIGVVPNAADILAGPEGFATVDVPFQSAYEEFLFGTRFKLHSMTADFWSHFGIVGIVFAVAIGAIMLAAFAHHLTSRTATALTVFLVVANLWNLAVQPIYSSLPSMGLMLGILLLERSSVSHADGPHAAAQPRRESDERVSAQP